MGIERLSGANAPFDPVLAARTVASLVRENSEQVRKLKMRTRVCLYRDDHEQILTDVFGYTFDNPKVLETFRRLARLAGYSSFLKRISDEVARPLYATSPTRRVYRAGQRAAPTPEDAPATEQETFMRLAEQAGWDDAMDTAARLQVGCPPVFIVGRFVDELGVVFDVVTSDSMSVIPDPRKPTRALGLIYDRVYMDPATGSRTHSFVCVDDTRQFEVSADGQLVGEVKAHGLGRVPVVEVHGRGRWGSYWSTRGQDLEVAALSMMFLDAVILKKHRSQSHLQLAFAGQSNGLAKHQVLDEDSLLTIDGEGSFEVLDLQADPTALLKTKEAIETTVAANYGISRDRLNQKSAEEQNAALNERTAEVAGVMARVEADAFDLLCRLSQANKDPAMRLDAKTMRLRVDFQALSMRMSPMDALSLSREKRKAGTRDVLDDVFEQNPEIRTELDAWNFVRRKMMNESLYITMRRALNVPEDATVDEPGQDAAKNGAMGPKVRDGELTRDDAAKQAKTGAPKGGDRRAALLKAIG